MMAANGAKTIFSIGNKNNRKPLVPLAMALLLASSSVFAQFNLARVNLAQLDNPILQNLHPSGRPSKTDDANTRNGLPAEEVHFSCLAKAHSREFKRLHNLYTESFAKLGVSFKMTSLTEPEILRAFKQQRFDGDCARIAEFFPYSFKTHYSLLKTSAMNMKVNIYGRKSINDLSLKAMTAATQPGSEFLRGLANHYRIKLWPRIEDASDAWPLFENNKINSYIGISAMFPGDEPKLKELGIGPEYTLARFPVYPVLSNKWQSIKPTFERILRHNIKTSADLSAVPKVQDSKIKAVDPGTIQFSCPITEDTPVFNKLIELYSEAFGKLGYKFTMVAMSRSREAYELIKGTVDGTCGRINVPSGPTKTPPQKINIVISQDDFEIWSNKRHRVMNSLVEIPSHSKVSYRQDLFTSREINKARHLVFIARQQVEQTFEDLNAGTSDFVTDLQIQVDNSIDNVSLTTPIYYAGRLGVVTVNPYLSYHRRELTAPLEKSLRAILGGKIWSDTLHKKSDRK